MNMNFRRHRVYHFLAISKMYRRAIKANKKTIHKSRNYTENLNYWPALLICTLYFMACQTFIQYVKLTYANEIHMSERNYAVNVMCHKMHDQMHELLQMTD